MPVDRVALAELEALERERERRKGASDPSAFARTLGFTADPWQERVLRSRSRSLLLNCPRQSGKSTTAALIAIWTAFYHPGSMILIVAPSLRQSGLMIIKVQEALHRLPVAATLKTDSKTEVSFVNGSRIVSLPADEAKIRGYSAVDLLVLDEAGDVPDLLYKTVTPMLIVSKGRVLIMGTPKGRHGFFFERWERGGAAWERHEVPWQDVPRFDPADMARQKVELGEMFEQEFCCKFIALKGGTVFSAFSETANCVEHLPKSEAWSYLLGLDLGFVDDTAFAVLGWLPNDPVLYVVCSEKHPGFHANDIASKIKALRSKYPFTRIVADTGGYGKGPCEEMRSRFGIHVESAPKQDKVGYTDQLNGAFAMGLVKVYRPGNVDLVHELVTLPWNDERTAHRDGFPNHLADSLLYGWRVSSTYLQQPAPSQDLTPHERIQAETKAHWDRVTESRKVEWWEKDVNEGAEGVTDPYE